MIMGGSDVTARHARWLTHFSSHKDEVMHLSLITSLFLFVPQAAFFLLPPLRREQREQSTWDPLSSLNHMELFALLKKKCCCSIWTVINSVFIRTLCPHIMPHDLIETNLLKKYWFLGFLCSLTPLYLSCLSMHSPCPLSRYLPTISSSFGLLVTMETSQFALLLSTFIHIFSPILFPLPLCV